MDRARHALTVRRRVLLCLLVVVPAGFATRLEAGPATPWVRDLGGGILYVVFWILLVLLLWPRLRARRVALGVFVVTCLLELLQLWQTPALEPVRATFLGQTVIGSTFSLWDFPPYALGCLGGAWLGGRLQGALDPSALRGSS